MSRSVQSVSVPVRYHAPGEPVVCAAEQHGAVGGCFEFPLVSIDLTTDTGGKESIYLTEALVKKMAKIFRDKPGARRRR